MNKLSLTVINKKITMVIFILFVLILLPTLFILIQKNKVGASPVTGFNAGKIIDDSVFINSNTMNVSQIQSFLNSKATSCDTNGSQPATEYGRSDLTHAQYAAASGWSAPPYTCLKNYSENSLSSAQIIYNISQQYKINSQILIVLLQKEQGLVTDTWPLATQYRTATGYGCPDTAACDTQYYGFTNQLTWSAKMFRAIMDNNPNWYTPYVLGNNYIQWNPNSSCSGSTVNIQNRSTQALYNYTPYQPNQAALNAGYGSGDSCSAYGNRNFYLYFTDWFGSVVGSPIYKSSDSNSIYYVVNNTKYHIASFDIYYAYGLQKYSVTTVDDAYLERFSTGVDLTSTIGKKEADPSGTIYMFDDGKRYPVDITSCSKYPDGSTILKTSWAIDCFNSSKTLSLPNELIDNNTKQDITLTDVILYDNSAWKVEDGKKHRITDPAFIDVFGGWGKTRWISSANVPKLDGKMLILDNSTVKFSNSPILYFLSNAELHPILGYGEYSAWAINKYPVYEFPAEYNTADPIAIGSNLSFCAKDYSGQYYLLSLNASKIKLDNSPNTWGYSNEECTQSTSAVLSKITTIENSGIYRSESGDIFTIDNSLKRYSFPTVDDIVYSGYDTRKIINLSNVFESKLTYGGLKLSPGRLFKVKNEDTIRYVVNEGASLAVYSTNINNLPYSKLITVDSTTGVRYPVISTYK